MPDVFDYLKWRGDLKLWHAPFCAVDALILTELAYMDHAGIVPERFDDGLVTLSDDARRFKELHVNSIPTLGAIVPAKIIDLFYGAAKAPRFSELGLCGYVNIVNDSAVEQFSAYSVKLSDGSLFVGFRGTDDSIAGWKENFQMSFKTPVPAQHSAAEYLNKAADHYKTLPLRIGGHSKGGNLAMWAAANSRSDVRERIIEVYNFDGPGFLKNFHESDGYHAVKDRIKTVVPEKSVVGMFLEHEGNYKTVKSSEKGIMQHDALSWQVEGTDFQYADDLSPDAKRFNEILRAWIGSLGDDFREKFTDAFFGILYATNSTTLSELMSDRSALLHAFTFADPETKQALSYGLRTLLDESGRSIVEWLKKKQL